MTVENYYTAPPQEVFEEIKKAAIEVWETKDNTYGYATEKINGIRNLENVSDNAWYMVAMFDSSNREILLSKVSEPTRLMILDAMMS